MPDYSTQVDNGLSSTSCLPAKTILIRSTGTCTLGEMRVLKSATFISLSTQNSQTSLVRSLTRTIKGFGFSSVIIGSSILINQKIIKIFIKRMINVFTNKLALQLAFINMQSSQDTIKALQQAIAKEDLAQILKLSSSLMKQNPQDLEYKQCYCIAAIKSKSYGELSTGIFKQKPHDKGLERIFYYYLYSSCQFQRCIEALAGTKDQALQLLLAQAYFNVLDYDKSIEIMSDLLRVVKLSHEDKELYTVNLLAAATPKMAKKVEEFEFLITSTSCKQMLYNFSLFLYSIGNIEKALKFLSLFEDGLEKDDEIDRVTAKLFRDYISMTTKQGGILNREKKCQEYKNLLKTIKDQNLQCVLNNNIIFLSNNHDLIGQHYKNLQELNDPKIKISLLQSIALRINKLSFLNRKNRLHESHKVLNELQSHHNILKNNEFIINKYFVFKKSKEFDNAHNYVKAIMQENINLGFCLLVDLCQELGDTKSIIDSLQVLSKSQNEHAKNYIFSLLIRDANLFSQYSSYLDDLIQKSKQIKTLQILLKLYQNKEDKKKQILVYNRILEVNNKNSAARVGLAQVYLEQGDIDRAQDLLKGIQKPSEITDLNYLQYIEKNIHVSKKEEDTHVTEDEKKAAHKKRIKKKKRLRLPKNVEKLTPGFKPDPERWLPKWQRKGYKKKGKKGAGNKTQGLSTVGMEEKNIYNANNSTSAKQVTKDSKRRR